MTTIWCRVRDLSTGHHYDVPLSRLDALEARDAVREIPGRRIRARLSRPAKHFRRLDGRRGTPDPAAVPADDPKEL